MSRFSRWMGQQCIPFVMGTNNTARIKMLHMKSHANAQIKKKVLDFHKTARRNFTNMGERVQSISRFFTRRDTRHDNSAYSSIV